MKSFADDYVTDYDVTWPVFTVKTIEQWCNCYWRPIRPLGCRAFISCTNLRYAFV